MLKCFASYTWQNFTTGGSHSSVEVGFADELQEFVDCIREGRTRLSSIESSYHAMCVVDAIRKSLETGESVLL